uniref:Tf2-1-like SH3-like domain-containing protein n=1 Tax=Ananas comosus var. bracteatus TaxID=296719 RepID=A0A6V7P1S5_ANACO|nr:unnamed protein product [Ananas comosus var. bracteatus]
MEAVNRSLGNLLRSLVGKNIRQWDLVLPQAEFAYNRSSSQTAGASPFQVVYGRNPISPLDLPPLSTTHAFSSDADEQAKHIKQLHEQVRARIIKHNEKYQKATNKHRKPAAFKEGDLVWVHLCKEHFPQGRHGKLKPRADGPFKVLKRIGENAYKIELPGDYNISATFNVADLSPYYKDDPHAELEDKSERISSGNPPARIRHDHDAGLSSAATASPAPSFAAAASPRLLLLRSRCLPAPPSPSQPLPPRALLPLRSRRLPSALSFPFAAAASPAPSFPSQLPPPHASFPFAATASPMPSLGGRSGVAVHGNPAWAEVGALAQRGALNARRAECTARSGAAADPGVQGEREGGIRITRAGSVVVTSVHQPSRHVLGLVDRLLILSRGRAAYCGDPRRLADFLAVFGCPSPPARARRVRPRRRPLLEPGASSSLAEFNTAAAEGRDRGEHLAGKLVSSRGR